ncbi:MAG TPA: hypothetical protein VFF33_13350 [Ignavibacteriaceae bacterium]|nr:hypothetical protein [Ignavibacteriaceae bacterium]
MTSKELLDLIETELTETTYKSLVSYALFLINNYLWLSKVKRIPEGKTAEDFVQDTIFKIINGDRDWDTCCNQNFVAILKSHIKSIIYAAFTKKEYRFTTAIIKGNDDEEVKSSDLTEIMDTNINILSNIEHQEELTKIHNAIKSDKELQDLVTCFELGIYKRKEISEFLGISVDEVTNCLKRLHRKTSKLSTKD